MKRSFYGIILAAFLVIHACKTTAATKVPDRNIRDAVNSADVVLIDVRVPEQYSENTAKNAINIPLSEFPANTASLKGKKIVVFCNKGIQADQAMEILKKEGIEAYDGTTWKNVKAIQDEKAAGK